jgi:hypothetical protein
MQLLPRLLAGTKQGTLDALMEAESIDVDTEKFCGRIVEMQASKADRGRESICPVPASTAQFRERVLGGLHKVPSALAQRKQQSGLESACQSLEA